VAGHHRWHPLRAQITHGGQAARAAWSVARRDPGFSPRRARGRLNRGRGRAPRRAVRAQRATAAPCDATRRAVAGHGGVQ
jgi:hypothetical protein